MSVIFITPYPLKKAPSQRFRFEQHFERIKEKDITIHHQSFFSVSAWNTIYKDGKSLIKVYYILIGFLNRCLILLRSKKYDFYFIHREASPIGPPIFEWFISKILRRKIIYDFDDAIWLDDPNEKRSLKTWLKGKWKVKKICQWSHKVSAGNQYLADFARNYNPNVYLIPTTIDTNKHDPNNYSSPTKNKLVIGWTGSHSTLQYLELIVPIIEQLEKDNEFEFLVIANKNPQYPLKSFIFQPWKKESEIEDLLKIDIGIMPLLDDDWSRGKCGFKALQYLALEKPALVSPVGVNKKIVQDGITGFHCSSTRDWKDKLRLLLKNTSLRLKMGEQGRKFVETNYSVKANSELFLSLFE